MTDNKAPDLYDEVIDLREIINTLLHYKWAIVSITLFTTLSVFLVSYLILPPTYQASAFVAITEPVITAELDPSIQVSPTIPDAQALSELAEAEEVKEEVSENLGLEDHFQNMEPEMEASLKGKNQVLLEVTTKSSELSAEIANVWAEVFVRRLNDLYGTGEKTLVNLEAEVKNAKENWNRSQTALEEYLPQSRVEVLEVQLSDEKNSLATYMNRIERNEILISDAEVLLSQMTDFDDGLTLPTGNALSIIALQQRASGGISGTQFQIQNNEILGEGYSILEGRESIQELILSLENQVSEFERKLPILESSISELSVNLESEKFKVEQLVQERDLARNAYNALSAQLVETRIKRSQDEYSAKVATKAVVPQNQSGPNTIIYSAIALVLGFLLSVSGTMFYEWWKKEE